MAAVAAASAAFAVPGGGVPGGVRARLPPSTGVATRQVHGLGVGARPGRRQQGLGLMAACRGGVGGVGARYQAAGGGVRTGRRRQGLGSGACEKVGITLEEYNAEVEVCKIEHQEMYPSPAGAAAEEAGKLMARAMDDAMASNKAESAKRNAKRRAKLMATKSRL